MPCARSASGTSTASRATSRPVRAEGLNEDIVRLISAKNEEPEWLTEWRLRAYRRWVQLDEHPTWAMLRLPEIDFQEQYYYARPKSMSVRPKSLDESIRRCSRPTRSSGYR